MRNIDCRWITCDQHFKYNTCLLKQYLSSRLYDEFKFRGMKHPSCAALLDDSCSQRDGCGFVNARGPDGLKTHCDPEKDERDAMFLTGEIIRFMGQDGVAAIYRKLMSELVENREKELARVQEALDAEREDMNSVKTGTGMALVPEQIRSVLDAWGVGYAI